jgi:DNA-binding PadR family transcriptional regulator
VTIDINTFLPLTEPVFFILLSLAPGPQHGYAIMKETAVLSEGRASLSTSTLYSAIKRLLDQGLIARAPEASGVENGRERKAYRLTSLGRRVLEAETVRLQALLAAARQSQAKATS